MVPSLHNVPNEVADDILSYLSPSDLVQVLRTGHSLHDVAARRLYRHVTISNMSSWRFFKTISESKECYGRYTITLWYRELSGANLRLNCVLFVEALSNLPRLRNLKLHILPNASTHLLYAIDRRVTPRKHPNQRISTPWIPQHDCHEHQKSLELLTTFKLYGDVKLVRLVNRTTQLTTLVVTEPMDSTDLLLLAASLVPDQLPNSRLKRLEISVHRFLGEHISAVINLMGEKFPMLDTLMVRSPIINALVSVSPNATAQYVLNHNVQQNVTQLLQFKPDLLTHVRVLVFNDWTIVSPVFIVDSKTAQERQINDVIAAKRTRPNLASIRFGHSFCEQTGDKYAWEITELTDSKDQDDAFPEARLDTPLFWEIQYNIPEDISRTNLSHIFED